MGVVPWTFHGEISLEESRASKDTVAQGLYPRTSHSR